MLEKSEGVGVEVAGSRGVEGVEANMDVADAEDLDGEDLSERQPKPGRRPNIPTKAEINALPEPCSLSFVVPGLLCGAFDI